MVLSNRGSAVFRRNLAPAPALKLLHIINKFSFSFKIFFFFILTRTLGDVVAALPFCPFAFLKSAVSCFRCQMVSGFFTLNGYFFFVPLLLYFQETLRVSECFRFFVLCRAKYSLKCCSRTVAVRFAFRRSLAPATALKLLRS